MRYPVSPNIQCILHDTLLALLAGQRYFAVRLSSNSLHWRRRARCARHQAGLLIDGRSRLCARGRNESGIGDAEGLEGGGRSRCTVVSLLVAVLVVEVLWRGATTYRAGPWPTLALSWRTWRRVCLSLLRVRGWRVESGGGATTRCCSCIR